MVLFLADSQVERMDANQESMENLSSLEEQGYNLESLPFVVQYNKGICQVSLAWELSES